MLTFYNFPELRIFINMLGFAWKVHLNEYKQA